MKKVKFYVDFCFEAGSEEGFSANVGSHYQFGVKLSDMNTWSCTRYGIITIVH